MKGCFHTKYEGEPCELCKARRRLEYRKDLLYAAHIEERKDGSFVVHGGGISGLVNPGGTLEECIESAYALANKRRDRRLYAAVDRVVLELL